MKKDTSVLLTPDVSDVITTLKGKAYFVGGSVRDFLNNTPIGDIDMATPFLPEQSMDLLTAAGYRVIPTGLRHGTITVLTDARRTIELTTFRKDIETDGRHAKVVFSTDMKQDAARRDFTINAMYMAKDGTVFDFYHGQRDLKKHIVRFIGTPEDRINEDALRIMRFFRFWGRFGGKKPPIKALRACQKNAFLLTTLSRERKRDELLKILALPNAPLVLHFMYRYGILNTFIETTGRFDGLHHFIRLEKKHARDLGVLPRLYLILKNKADLPQLAMSNAQKKELKTLARLVHMDLSSHHARRKAAFLTSRETTEKAVYIQRALSEKPISFALSRELVHLSVPVFPVSAADLTALGIPAGPRMGEMLQKAIDIWIKMNFTEKKELVLNAFKR